MLFPDFQPVQMSHLTAMWKSVQSHLKSCRSPQRLSCSNFPLKSKLEGKCTKKDAVLSQVLNFMCNGWPTSGPECKMDALKPYANAQICEVNSVLLRDCHVIVPQELQSKMITMLHQSHRGIVLMKTMALLYVWWPNIDTRIKTSCKPCNVCTVTAPAPASNLPSCLLPDEPWDRIHMDFVGQFLGDILVMDAHSKWPSLVGMPNYPNTETTTMALGILYKYTCLG